MQRDDAYLLDILLAARKVRAFVAGRSRRDFAFDEQLQLSVLHLIQIMGEAAGRVSAQTRDTLPGIPWASMVGMRNILVHRYWNIDLDRVWAAATISVIDLIAILGPVVPPDDP